MKREKCKVKTNKFYPLLFKLDRPSEQFKFKFPGDNGEGEPPVPIPNTAVKPLSADGTCRATGWESKSSPGLILNKDLDKIEVFVHSSAGYRLKEIHLAKGLLKEPGRLMLRSPWIDKIEPLPSRVGPCP